MYRNKFVNLRPIFHIRHEQKNSPARHSRPRLVPGHRRRNTAPDRPDRRGVDARRGPRALRRKLRRRRVPPPHAGRHGLYGQPLRLPADHHTRLAGHARDRGHALDARRDRLAVGGLHVERRRGADRRPQRPRSLPPDRPDAGRNPPPARPRQPYGHGGRRSRVGRGDGGPRRRSLLARPRTLRLGHLALLRTGSARVDRPQQRRAVQPLLHRLRVAAAARPRPLCQYAQHPDRIPREARKTRGGAAARRGRPGTCGRLRTAALHPRGQYRGAGTGQAAHRPIQARRRRDARPALRLPRRLAPHQRSLRARIGRGRGHVLPVGPRPGRLPDLRLRAGQGRQRDGGPHLGPRNQPLLRRDDRRAGPVQRPAVRGDSERIPQRPLRHGRLGGDLRRQVHLAQP